MSEDVQLPAGAVPSSEAFERFGDQDLYTALRNAPHAGRGALHPGLGATDAEWQATEDFLTRRRAHAAAASRFWQDFYARLLEGHLVAAGRRGDPAAALTIIPPDAWKYLELDGVNDVAWYGKEKWFYDVRIAQACEDSADGQSEEDADAERTGKLRFSRSTVTTEYRKRVSEWPEDKLSPSREDEEKWGRKNYRVPREIIRELRKKYAPEHWKATGPKIERK